MKDRSRDMHRPGLLIGIFVLSLGTALPRTPALAFGGNGGNSNSSTMPTCPRGQVYS
jgi:hypothetical protein